MFGLSGRSRRKKERRDTLNAPLLRWASGTIWTVRDALEGTLALGATGSGKSSGSGRFIAQAMLRAGFGGLVLTAKPDERSVWERYCHETGRSDDLIVFGPDTPHRFNFLDHEATRQGSGAGLTENIVSLLATVLEVAERNSAGGSGRDDEGYWKRANRQLCRNIVDLLLLAKGRVTVPDMYRVVVSAPTSADQLASDEWKEQSACFRWLSEADARHKTLRERSDFGIVADYWLLEFPGLSDKTRSVIVSTFTSMVDVLNRGILRELFCEDTDLVPEATQDGRIILIDLSVKEFAEVGVFAQVLWKHAFQRSIERRNIADSPRPVFLWADEAQHFVTSYDMQFQTTCRAARVATVLLSQNYSNFIAALGGGEKGRAETDSLLANLNTKVMHANGDPVTNEWAAGLIGRSRQFMASGNTSYSAEDEANAAIGMSWLPRSGSSSAGFSEVFEYEVQPREFTRLRTGGPANRGLVDAIVFQNGKVFKESGRNWLPVTFKQQL
ncbi:MAG: hypothetical protein IPM18_00975 [Phycisphaerales bacterium]|nr:hypothetical protein [Phycisphaerales bacterium]